MAVGLVSRPGRARSFDLSKASQLVGVVMAVVVVVLLNVASARRFTRWDWTANKRYSLSPATVQTLHDLPDVLQVWVLLGSADPLGQSVKQLLVAYQGETGKLEVHYVDPDRDTLAFEDLRKRFSIDSGRTEAGHIVADAVVVVARGENHWFVTSGELVELADADAARVRPREERALTLAIRNVVGGGTKLRLCFTSGHGEMSPLDAGERGAGALREILEKDNFTVAQVDLSSAETQKPLEGCAVAIVAGLQSPFAPEESERLRTWLLEDGNLFLAASPLPPTMRPDSRPSTGEFSRVLGPFGIALDADIVTEPALDEALALSGGFRFLAQARKHPVTAALVASDHARDVPRIVVDFTRSMHASTESGSVIANELLSTSPRAYGLVRLEGAAEWKETPKQQAGDLSGPLTLAMAAERPRASAAKLRGPRVVVTGTSRMLGGSAFREAATYRGGALFASSALSWLASKPQILDVPEKAAVATGMRVSEASRSEIRRYVVFFMPATVAMLGIAMAVFRRAGEGKKRASTRPRQRDVSSHATRRKKNP